MSQSIRFFCPHCSLIIKIGPQMFGKTVVCPQCEKKVEVPFESDPKAEGLYCFLKEKKRERKGKKKLPLPPKPPIPESLAPIPRYPSTFDENPDEPVRALSGGTFEHVEPGDIDRWINEFWAGVPEQERLNYQNIQKEEQKEPLSLPDSLVGRVENSFNSLKTSQANSLFRFLLTIVFLSGCILGFLLHAFVIKNPGNKDSQLSSSAELKLQKIRLEGNLLYKKNDAESQPDADAVIIFVPANRIPTFPISYTGLAPNDPNYRSDMESVQQIEELGGVFLRTGADGRFSAELPSEGRYVGLLISSHLLRGDSEKEIGKKTLEDLRRFFRNPQNIIGEYCFSKDEYDFEHGTYFIRQTFRP